MESIFPSGHHPSLFIRQATVEDIPLIRAVADEVWPATYSNILSPAQIAYMMEMMYSAEALEMQMQQGHEFLLVYGGDEAVGFASFNKMETAIFKLQKIYVASSQQGRGTGKALLDYVVKEVIKNGGSKLQLNVNRHNKAKGFYDRLGFVVLKEEKIDIGGGYVMDDYVMELVLREV